MKVKLSVLKIFALALFSATVLVLPARCMDGDGDMPEIEELDLDPSLFEARPTPEGSRAPIDAGAAGMLGGFFTDINLKDPLWITTKPEKGRDILYLMPSKITSIEYGGGSCNLFFNMTSKMYLTGSNLLNIDQIDSQLLGALLGLIPLPAGIQNPNQIGLLLPFTKKITIQERKFGPYFQTGFVHGAFILQCHTSLQVGVRNFWLNKRDQEEIRQLNELIFGESQQFDDSNLYRVRVGLGDTRVKLGLNALNSKLLQTDVGMECILPTSRSSRKTLPEVDVDSSLNDDTTIFKAAFDSLFNIRDYLLTPEIGNGGHFGLGFYLESKFNLFNGLAELITRASFDKFFESEEQRLMLQKKSVTAADLVAIPVGATPAEALALVTKFAKQYLIPLPYKVDIEPGGIFNGIMILNIPYKKWNFRYGYDFYYQQAEQFKKVYADADTLPLLSVERARVGSIIQHKISSETTYRIKKFNNINLDLGFGGDTTISAHNIGKDWTMYVKIASEF
jgi:hypothetical protein